AVGHEARAPVDGPASGLVTLVPRREGRHRDARVDCDQRRIRSSVARTCSAVSLGNRRPGTATRPRPRRASLIGVAAGSTSSPPSAIVISTACPAPRPRTSRSAFGTTMRPAASMVVLMAFAYHPAPTRNKRSAPALGPAHGRVDGAIVAGSEPDPTRTHSPAARGRGRAGTPLTNERLFVYAGHMSSRAATARAREAPSTRDAILDAAERRFAERGFAGVSMREIAAEAGLKNQASLYHHFRH